ncbi:MAG TPA: nucleoside-diphosphate kinase [Acidobacteriota bacterium]|jgi:nucleoside-diphosphate kinase|nr:nucleoside-diphosphate kinase [Acidobacteriota bacterium]HNT17299.1 nucleoside-diphosphate kinase [Acidobacteriota bacterium]HPA26362.1 nucleoside-diphosphate kinase [Acidobacteriota bacterium]HQO19742.1 nucleoside-diphosphate kinase [Acidobacteriota bacterium]HQQ46344.1 nucleoside-diphosphate kinase [Acidobacteriota bacterium]
MKERTLTIIKPDSVVKKTYGSILQILLDKGFDILKLRWIRLTREQARAFYEVHKGKPFYGELVEFMTSGPVIAAALERDNAISYLREVMGATDPKKADPASIRSRFAESIQRNAIHGSDSPENARKEVAFFFAGLELEQASAAAEANDGK